MATPPPPDQKVTDATVMKHHVSQAVARLADGEFASRVMEALWRAGYACGVRRGAAGTTATGVPGASLAGREGPVPQGQDGWLWGPPHTVSAVFSYGGTDPAKPTCDRPARALTGTHKMELEDTAERVRIPVLLWHKPREAGR